MVFTDIEMPGSMDGLKLAHAIRERWPPVLLLLASGRAVLEESQMPRGALFLSKPYVEEQISTTLRRLMAA